jgi:hypothetical protein
VKGISGRGFWVISNASRFLRLPEFLEVTYPIPVMKTSIKLLIKTILAQRRRDAENSNDKNFRHLDNFKLL